MWHKVTTSRKFGDFSMTGWITLGSGTFWTKWIWSFCAVRRARSNALGSWTCRTRLRETSQGKRMENELQLASAAAAQDTKVDEGLKLPECCKRRRWLDCRWWMIWPEVRVSTQWVISCWPPEKIVRALPQWSWEWQRWRKGPKPPGTQ